MFRTTKKYIVEEIIFVRNVEKLINKIKNSEGKSQEKILEYVVRLKIEVESYFRVSINTDAFFEEVVKEIESRGAHVDCIIIKQIKKKVKKIQKKLQKGFFGFEKADYKQKKHKKKGENKVEVPDSIAYGISLVCAGCFLKIFPIPVCQTSADWCFSMGVGIIFNYVWLEHNKDEEEENE